MIDKKMLEDGTSALLLPQPRIVSITHFASMLANMYAVETIMSDEQLNDALAYLQLLRFDLPSFVAVEDVLPESDMVDLLHVLYGCTPIVAPKLVGVQSVIELSDNWDFVALGADRESLSARVGHPGAVSAILQRMLLDAKGKKSGAEDIAQLEHILAGGDVPIEWGLLTLSGAPYYGTIKGGIG